MPLTPDQAAAVARQHGLTLTDASALQAMARTVDEAHQLAAQFVPTLPERIERAEQAGDWVTAMNLKSQMLAERRQYTNADGYFHGPPTDPTTEPPPPDAPPPAPDPPPVHELVPGMGNPNDIGHSLPDLIARAEAAGDWQQAMVLKSQQVQQIRAQMEGHQ